MPKPLVLINGKPVLYDWLQRTCDRAEVTAPGDTVRRYVPTQRRATIVTRDNRAYTFYDWQSSMRPSGRQILEFRSA